MVTCYYGFHIAIENIVYSFVVSTYDRFINKKYPFERSEVHTYINAHCHTRKQPGVCVLHVLHLTNVLFTSHGIQPTVITYNAQGNYLNL